MSFQEKLNLNYLLLTPLGVLCIRWLLDGNYIAFILALVFAFVLYAVIEEKTNVENDKTGEEE